jgi:hypothetical protein
MKSTSDRSASCWQHEPRDRASHGSNGAHSHAQLAIYAALAAKNFAQVQFFQTGKSAFLNLYSSAAHAGLVALRA